MEDDDSFWDDTPTTNEWSDNQGTYENYGEEYYENQEYDEDVDPELAARVAKLEEQLNMQRRVQAKPNALDDFTQKLDDLLNLDFDIPDIAVSNIPAVKPTTAQPEPEEDTYLGSVTDALNSSTESLSISPSTSTPPIASTVPSEASKKSEKDMTDDDIDKEMRKMLADIARQERKAKQEESKNRKLIRVSLPHKGGSVTLDFVHLAKSLDYINNKRPLLLKKEYDYAFKYEGNDEVILPLTMTMDELTSLNLHLSNVSGAAKLVLNIGSEKVGALVDAARWRARAASIKSLRTLKKDPPPKQSTMPVRGSVPVDTPSREKELLTRKPSKTFLGNRSSERLATSPLGSPTTARANQPTTPAAPAPQPVPSNPPPIARTVSSRRSMSPLSMDRTGYLNKEGGKIKSWKKRYFVMKGASGKILYAKKQNSGELGVIDLEGISAEKVRALGEYKKRKFIIAIDTPKRIFYLQAESQQEQSDWFESIRRAVVFLNEKKKPISIQDFEVLAAIGKGNYGRVLQVMKKDSGMVYAMKILDKSRIIKNEELEQALTEKRVLQNAIHPFIVQLYFSFQSDTQLFFVLDYVSGGELLYRLQQCKHFDEDTARFYAAEILCAIEYLHNLGVIYRDLKLENILINDDGHIMLTDFGLSKTGMNGPKARTKTVCGTPEYLAPEILTEQGYTNSVDYWSLGVAIYEMLTGSTPFNNPDVIKLYNMIANADVEYPPTMSEVAKSLIQALLQRNAQKRLDDPSAIKKHPFFSKMDFDKLVAKEIVPPYIPDVMDKTDTSNVAPKYKLDKAALKDDESNPMILTGLAQQQFSEFSFFAPSSPAKATTK
eukprot:CAMPEP_0168573782 /NCGR_PEP_ID=MMETSP0413-20121227/18721_1 /TAXON_ID=136452 /ORGANISM="Filamoeba nolandi, Strain NC-AS-23-1" /LENGTH=831 /DNA_ID=CAMNT_0008607061 /DNA_START=125 /DNA_END=2619 /DNA_ORIENTATION=+